MTTTHSPKEIAAGLALAGIALCLGVYVSMRTGDAGGTALMRLCYLVAVFTVLKFTFAWGRLRGFPARSEDGRISIPHVFRSLVMAVIVWGVLILVSTPLAIVAFRLAQ